MANVFAANGIPKRLLEQSVNTLQRSRCKPFVDLSSVESLEVFVSETRNPLCADCGLYVDSEYTLPVYHCPAAYSAVYILKPTIQQIIQGHLPYRNNALISILEYLPKCCPSL